MPLGPAADNSALWINGVSVFLDEHREGASSLFIWTVAHQGPMSVGILQAKILEGVAMPSCRGSSQ